MNENPLKLQSYAVTFAEVPDEICLCLNISGCNHCCPGCHSQHLWNGDKDRPLSECFDTVVNYLGGRVSCLVFMGGDYNIEELLSYAVKAKERGLKVCVYTGADFESPEAFELEAALIAGTLDYLKVGPYVEEFGGLASAKTNQRMFAMEDGIVKDITWKFWRNEVLGYGKEAE